MLRGYAISYAHWLCPLAMPIGYAHRLGSCFQLPSSVYGARRRERPRHQDTTRCPTNGCWQPTIVVSTDNISVDLPLPRVSAPLALSTVRRLCGPNIIAREHLFVSLLSRGETNLHARSKTRLTVEKTARQSGRRRWLAVESRPRGNGAACPERVCFTYVRLNSTLETSPRSQITHMGCGARFCFLLLFCMSGARSSLWRGKASIRTRNNTRREPPAQMLEFVRIKQRFVPATGWFRFRN